MIFFCRQWLIPFPFYTTINRAEYSFSFFKEKNHRRIAGATPFIDNVSRAPCTVEMETNDRHVSFVGGHSLEEDDSSIASMDTTDGIYGQDMIVEEVEEEDSEEANDGANNGARANNEANNNHEIQEDNFLFEEDRDPLQMHSPFDVENSMETGYFQGDEETEEAKQGCYATGVPRLEEWEEKKNEKIFVTVGRSRQRLWTYATNEISTIKSNIESLVVRGADDIILENDLLKIYKFLFGTNSNLFRVFENQLGLSKNDYLKFMRTFFLSCKNKQTVSALWATFDIQHDYYMDIKNYNRIWNEIGKLTGSLANDCFWQEIEAALNKCMRALFYDVTPGAPHMIAIDDDKLHFSYGYSSKAEGLKHCHHAKDNRRGFTVHTAAYPASQVPVGAYFQREGESVQATYLRMVKKMFGNNGGDIIPDLRNVTLASDRGYWMPKFLFNNLLEAGANIEGTVKRVSFFIFVFFCFVFFFYIFLYFLFFFNIFFLFFF